MVFQSKSAANIAICLAAMLMAASTTQAQISTAPKRNRSKIVYNKSNELGREQYQKQNEKKARKLEDNISMPLEESEFGMSIPLGSSARMMSLPLQDLRLDLSIPLQMSEFDFSMPTDEVPTQSHEDGSEEAIRLGIGSDSGGNTAILASFLAGISALMVGAVALFVKMRRKSALLAEENSVGEDMQVREVPFASPGDLNDLEEAGSEIIIT